MSPEEWPEERRQKRPRGPPERPPAAGIRLVALDVDGVLSLGNGRALDLDMLGELEALNARAEGPRVTLLTGRPAPFVEVLATLIGASVPAVYESGCGVFRPQPYGFLPHPDLPPQEVVEEARRRLWAGVVRPGVGFFQPGKEHSFTLFAREGRAREALEGSIRAALGRLADRFSLVWSVECVNVLPAGIDKGRGLDWLCQLVGVEPAAALAVGDSEVDLPFLRLAGHSAAPANAEAVVREAVEFVAPGAAAEGLREILAHYGMRARG